MKKILALMGLVGATFFVNQPANALLEGRLSYGFLTSATSLSSLCTTCTAAAPAIVPTYGMGADLILTLPIPLIPGVGVRYENMGLSASSGSLEFKAEYTRTALILNWRPINNIIYLGPIFTYGLSHSTSIKATESGTVKSNYSSSSVSSYSAGLEAGANLLGFRIGAEAGYQDMKWKDATDATGLGAKQDINMSGTYAKILFGVAF